MSAHVPDPATGTAVADPIARWTPKELAGRLREIYTDRDLNALRTVLAPHTVLRSPYISEHKFRFNNRDEVCYSMWAMLDFTEDLTVTQELVGDSVAGIQFRYVFGGRTVNAVILFHIDDDGQVDTIDLLIRGIVPLARFGRAISWRMVRPRTRIGFVGVYTPSTVSAVVTRVVDAMAAWLLSRKVPPNASKAMTLPPPRVPGGR